jgi:hypothetical protein
MFIFLLTSLLLQKALHAYVWPRGDIKGCFSLAAVLPELLSRYGICGVGDCPETNGVTGMKARSGHIGVGQ